MGGGQQGSYILHVGVVSISIVAGPGDFRSLAALGGGAAQLSYLGGAALARKAMLEIIMQTAA